MTYDVCAPNGYVYLGEADKYYRPFVDEKRTFYEAMEKCQEDSGATLVEFQNEHEFNALKRISGECSSNFCQLSNYLSMKSHSTLD